MIWFFVGMVIVGVSTAVTAIMLIRNVMRNVEKFNKAAIDSMSDERSTDEGPGAG